MERMLADLRTLRFRMASSSSSSSSSSPPSSSAGAPTLSEELLAEKRFDRLEANVEDEGAAFSGEAWLNRRLR